MIIHPYGIILGLGIVTGIGVAQRAASHINKTLEKDIESLAVWVFVGGLIGARVYHLITDWPSYVGSNFFALIAVWNGGLGIFGAVVGAVIASALFLWAKKKKLTVLPTYLDLIALGLPLGQAIGRWGNFVNQELYGLPTTLPWKIFIDVSHRFPGYERIMYYHPLFLYESLAMVVIWIVLWNYVGRHAYKTIGSGRVFAWYLVSYGVVRFFLDFLRLEASLIGICTPAQWVSVSLIAVSGAWLLWKKSRKKTS